MFVTQIPGYVFWALFSVYAQSENERSYVYLESKPNEVIIKQIVQK